MIIGELTFRFSHLSPRFWCSGICRRMRVVGKRRCTAVPLGGLFGNCCSLLSIMGKWGVVIIPLDELSLASPQMVSMGSSGFTRRCLSAFHTIIFFPLSNVFYKSTKDWKLNTIIYIYEIDPIGDERREKRCLSLCRTMSCHYLGKGVK